MKINIQIIELCEDDLEELSRLHVAVWDTTYRSYMPSSVLEENNFESRFEMWKKALEKKDQNIFLRLVKVDGELAGFVAGTISPRDDLGFDAELMAINILVKFHGRGIGKHLMDIVFELCRNHGSKNIYLWVATQNENAVNFYKKYGGKLEKFTNQDNGVDHLCFSWSLSDRSFKES